MKLSLFYCVLLALHVVLALSITRQEVLDHAQDWANRQIPYCQCNGVDCCGDCPYCSQYRCDCSGYVSFCWGLDHGYTTFNMLDVSHRINKADLQPGDAMLCVQEHVVLFDGWTDGSMTHYYGYQEPGCHNNGPHYAYRSVIEYPFGNNDCFFPVRYNHIDDCTPNCYLRTCGTDGCTGSCGTCPSARGCASSTLARCTSLYKFLTAFPTPEGFGVVFVGGFYGLFSGQYDLATGKLTSGVAHNPPQPATQVVSAVHANGTIHILYNWDLFMYTATSTDYGKTWLGGAKTDWASDEVNVIPVSGGKTLVASAADGGPNRLWIGVGPPWPAKLTELDLPSPASEVWPVYDKEDRLVLFYVSGYGLIMHMREDSPGKWSTPVVMCKECAGVLHASVILDRDGRVNLFFVDTINHLVFLMVETAAGSGSYNPRVSLGYAGWCSRVAILNPFADNGILLVANLLDDLYVLQQNSTGGFVTQDLHNPMHLETAYPLIRPDDGVYLVANGDDDRLYFTKGGNGTASTGAWAAWKQVDSTVYVCSAAHCFQS